jgi:hypothetical protein
MVEAGAAVAKLQAPLTQRSCVQTLLSLQAAQAAPAVPHLAAVWLPIATQAPALTQPVQHAPSTQTPLGHPVPSTTATLEQLPEEQESVVQGLLSLQFLQSPPPVPHTVVLVPVAQVPPLQQRLVPVQHDPPQQPPPVHDVPSVTGVPPHCPLVHVSLVRHSDMQLTHALPEPHAVTLDVTQELPLQHEFVPQQAPPQQYCVAVQQVIISQQVPPFGHPPGVQMACSTVPTSVGAGGSSIEHTERSNVAAKSDAATRNTRLSDSPVESSIGISSVARRQNVPLTPAA